MPGRSKRAISTVPSSYPRVTRKVFAFVKRGLAFSIICSYKGYNRAW